MKRALLASLALCAGCVTGVEMPSRAPAAAAPAPAPTPARVAPTTMAAAVSLRNAGFEEAMPAGDRCPRGWGCTMHNNPESFRFTLADSGAEGRRSLCIERVADEPWALATQGLPIAPLRGARVRLSMAVRGEGLSGPGIGPWILVTGRPRAHQSNVAKAAGAWQRLSVELAVPPTAETIEVGATLEGGGKACIDDVRLEIVAAPPGAKP